MGRWGELLIAMIARRAGREDAIERVVERYRKEIAYARQLESSRPILVAECFECQSRPALELARDLLKDEIENRENPPSPNNYRSDERLAEVYAKLGDRARAVRTWRDILEMPIPTYNAQPGYFEQQEINHRVQVAQKLGKNGFRLESIAAYEQALAAPSPRLIWRPNPEISRYKYREEERNLLLDVLSGGLDEAMSWLDAALASESPDLEAILTVTRAPWTARQQAKIPDWARGGDASWTSLAGAVMAASKRAGRLESLANRLDQSRLKHPKNESLEALSLVARLWLGDADAARPTLEKWSERLKRDDAIGPRGEALMLWQSAPVNARIFEVVARSRLRRSRPPR